ncbi:PLD nuclease N-terminal domain-containing protein [Kineosporia sp. A_224]|uniref:PLD nuclease N-terminal domain-containing protein n=1 Tax=Kineosporia sp. A_224 TaxID=1962180 RepID=UPI000B4BC4D1|nr:PLD nuclease N-terminal domain-containing protein [Kineosporia sp. A_224]
MGQAIVGLITVGVMIYGLVDCWRSDEREVRGLPRPLWFLVILIPLVGGIAWLVYGAPKAPGATGRGPRVLAPDDDPDFLRSLEQQTREQRRAEREERRRQAKEQRREEKEQRREEKERRDTGDTSTSD